MPRGRLDIQTVHCAALADNPRGDPVQRPCPVYLPEGYDPGGPRYPVVVLLHAFMGSAQAWFNTVPFGPGILDRLDALFASGAPPFITVFPDGFTALGGSQWIDSPGNGAYGQMLVHDVLGHVDRTYATLRSPASRAVGGRSSGGYGSWQLVRRFPGVFGHIASHSADSYFEYCYLPEFPKAASALVRSGGVQAWWEGFERRVRETKMGGDDHAVINLLAMASAYSPDVAQPLGVAQPFDLRTARIDEAVWASWLAEDPVRFVEADPDPYRSLESIFIDCGTRDEFGLNWGARMLARLVTGGRPKVVHEEYEDGHMGTTYRLDRSLAFLAPRLERRPA
ncbi:MAG TPA: alpha/beta hydrolase-fold protein [Myxococcaceae bacterium]|nr:alpha/beta hydrolase-fold protein [Myxococcaceae bacterium]